MPFTNVIQSSCAKTARVPIQSHEIRIHTVKVPPCNAHMGWVHLLVQDVHGIFSELELRYFECVYLTEERLVQHDPKLAGFFHNGGVYPYSEEFFGIEFFMDLTEADLTHVKNSASITL